ncbi:MAG: potassium channel family protein [Cyanobacteria bacterium P01_G01_bin.19]
MNFALKPKNKNKTKKKYTQLLTILIANFILAPFLRGNLGELVLSGIFLYTIILIVKTFSIRPILFRFFSSIAILAFVLEIIGRLELYKSFGVYLFLIQGVFALYLAVAIYLILRDILFANEVTVDIIRGGISVYLLIGFVWALLYGIGVSLDPQAFSQPLIEAESYGKSIYFSFTTLTTLGYGDIIPVSPWAKMLTNLEAIVGQLYPAILISILVSDYLSQRSK